jgi:hypothetical protein
MTSQAITIHVNPQVARAFKRASKRDRLKLETIVNVKLVEATRTQESLKRVMREISRKAHSRGLTHDILKELLNENQ